MSNGLYKKNIWKIVVYNANMFVRFYNSIMYFIGKNTFGEIR